MKIKTFFSVLYPLLLFFIQLYALDHNYILFPNIILLSFTYSYFLQYSFFAEVILLFFLELFSFIKFGIVGLTSTFIIPTSYILQLLSKKMRNPFIAPYILLVLYQLYEELILWFKLHHPVHLTILCYKLCIMTIMFIIGLILLHHSIQTNSSKFEA